MLPTIMIKRGKRTYPAFSNVAACSGGAEVGIDGRLLADGWLDDICEGCCSIKA